MIGSDAAAFSDAFVRALPSILEVFARRSLGTNQATRPLAYVEVGELPRLVVARQVAEISA